MSGRRPDDAIAFVDAIERATNEYRTDAIYDIFARQARSVTITDGAREVSTGVDAIHAAWAQACMTFKARQFQLRKQLVAATDDLIVNDWRGGPYGRPDGCGIEIWRFDNNSKVIEQLLYNYLKVRPPLHPIQTLKLLLGSPGMTIAAGRARLRRRPQRRR